MKPTNTESLSYKSTPLSPEIKNFISSLLSDIIASYEADHNIDLNISSSLNAKLQDELSNLDAIISVNKNNEIFELLMASLTKIYNDYKIKCTTNDYEFNIEYIKIRDTLYPSLTSDSIDLNEITTDDLLVETIKLFMYKKEFNYSNYINESIIPIDETMYNEANKEIAIYNTTTIELDGKSCIIKRVQL